MATIKRDIGRDGKPVYRLRVRVKGRPTQSASFSRLAEAKLWGQRTESGLHDTSYTVNDVISRCVREVLPHKAPHTTAYQGQQLRWWAERIGYQPLAALTPDHIAEQMAVLAKGPATMRRYLAVLGHALNVAMKRWGWLAENPVSRVTKPPEPRGRVRFLSDDKRQRLLAECRASGSSYLYIVVVLALSTGAWSMELLGLVWSQVDLKQGIIYLEATKNGERRSLPLTGHALDLMQQHANRRRSDTTLVFPGRTGAKPVYIRDAFLAAMKRAKIKDFRFHDLRHTAASYLAMQGCSLAEIAEVLYHRSLDVTRRYAHLSQNHTRTVMARLNEAIFGLEEGEGLLTCDV